MTVLTADAMSDEGCHTVVFDCGKRRVVVEFASTGDAITVKRVTADAVEKRILRHDEELNADLAWLSAT